jgi:hypothetical protein
MNTDWLSILILQLFLKIKMFSNQQKIASEIAAVIVAEIAEEILRP